MAESWRSPRAPLAALLFIAGLAIGFFASQQRGGAAATGVPPPRLLAVAAPAPADRFHQAPCPRPRQPGAERRNLVFAAVGDRWTPDKWSFSEESGWDLMAVYYGNSSEWGCPQCTLALTMPDRMKWQMLWKLMTSEQPQWKGIWERLKKQYDYILVSDDDLIMDSCTIDIFFDVMRRNELKAAQPSNCRGSDSDNPYWVHWQLPGLELHYVNVVEVAAPGLSMRFLDRKVRPLLNNTYSGWGLPYCFWAVAGFPPKKLATVDAACMMHPVRKDVGKAISVSERIRLGLVKPGSIYSRFSQLTPFESPNAEQSAVWEECGFEGPSKHGNAPAILGTVLAGPQAAAAAANTALAAGLSWQTPQQQQQRRQQEEGDPGSRVQQAGQALCAQPWQQPFGLLVVLALTALVGAGAALTCILGPSRSHGHVEKEKGVKGPPPLRV